MVHALVTSRKLRQAVLRSLEKWEKKSHRTLQHTVVLFIYLWQILSFHDLTRLKKIVSQRTSKLCNQFFYLPTFNTPCMSHLLYLMFRCDGDVMESLEFLWDLNTPYGCVQISGKSGRKCHVGHCSTLQHFSFICDKYCLTMT